MIKTLNHFWQKQVIRYLLVGAFNTLVGYLLYCFFIFIGLHFVWAVLVSNIISVVINFNTQGRIVFQHIHRRQFIAFACMVVINYFVNIGLIHLFFMVIPNYYVTGLMAVIILAISSFFISKYLIFVRRA